MTLKADFPSKLKITKKKNNKNSKRISRKYKMSLKINFFNRTFHINKNLKVCMTQVKFDNINDKQSRAMFQTNYKVKANKFSLKKKKNKNHSPLEEPFYHEL